MVGISETEAQLVEIVVNLILTLACHTFLALALCQLNVKKGVLPQALWGTSQRYLILSVETVIIFEIHGLLVRLSELIKSMEFFPRLLKVTAEAKGNRLH